MPYIVMKYIEYKIFQLWANLKTAQVWRFTGCQEVLEDVEHFEEKKLVFTFLKRGDETFGRNLQFVFFF